MLNALERTKAYRLLASECHRLTANDSAPKVEPSTAAKVLCGDEVWRGPVPSSQVLLPTT
jgi:hypothetical protein